MRKIVLTLYLASLTTGAAAEVDQAAELDQAKQAVAAFAGALKSELMSAMQSGGAIEAIEVCNSRAAAISEGVSDRSGMKLTRVSLKNRSPGNEPNRWQTEVLETFEARKKAGEEAGALSWHQLAETKNGHEFRFMKAIPTGVLCLQCHGETIAPPVTQKLAELYPGDKATGFKQGDIRGAFVVTRLID